MTGYLEDGSLGDTCSNWTGVGSTTPDAFCQLERPAGVNDARAVVSYAGTTYMDVLEPGVNDVRSDGLLVARPRGQHGG